MRGWKPAPHVLLLLPAFIVLAAVVIVPLLLSLYSSFTPFRLTRPDSIYTFIGFRNYERLLSDWDFWVAFGRTVLLLTFALNLEMVLGLLLALLVEKATRGQRILRTIMMFPMMFSPILVGFQFKFMFNDNIGVVNNALQSLGLTDQAIPWLIDGRLAFISILTAEIWSSTAVFAIFILAGLMAMPREPLEAAKVDGCTPWQSFRYVTWPFVMPFAYIAMTIRSLDIARAYDIVKIMTDGGPAGRTEILWTLIARTAYSDARMGLANAMSYIAILLSILFTVIFFRQLAKARQQIGAEWQNGRKRRTPLQAKRSEGRSPHRPVPGDGHNLSSGSMDRAVVTASNRRDHGQTAGLDPSQRLARRLCRDVLGRRAGRYSGARLFPQFADHFRDFDGHCSLHRVGRRLRIRPLPFPRQDVDLPRLHADTYGAGHSAFAAAVLRLCAPWDYRYAFRPDPRLCGAQRPVHGLAYRRVLPTGAARSLRSGADRRLHALAGLLAGRISAGAAGHRIGRDFCVPDLVERVRPGVAADPFHQFEDASGRFAGLHRGIHHRLARHVRARGRDDHSGADAYFHRTETPRLRTDVRGGQGIVMATVSLRNLVKKYGNLEVVHSINLDVADREFIALVGPSGCGKSTSLRMIAGLEDITGGEIRIGDRVVNDLPPRQRNISMVFQSYALYPHMSVAENMGFSLKIAGRPQSEIDAAVADAARTLSLEELLERRPSQLSGGQRQRVAMGRAIVRKPDVFLFDEPLSNLDAKLRMQMRTEIKKLHAQVQSTVIYVTHDQVEAMTLSDRIVIMRDGHIEQVGTPEEVFQRPATRFVAGFIGSPTMNLRDAEIADGKMVFANGDRLPIPPQFRDKVSAGGKVVFGIRPDDVFPAGHGIHSGDATDVHTIDVPVSITEPLGNETLVFAEFAGDDWIARMLNPKTLHPGDRVDLSFDLSQAHLFSADTEKTLRS